MGGVPVLLTLIAAMGITYGWQPDNNGGVEYIIQVSPDDLQEIERLGEISSVIDPAVRGHVSRVVVRVGRGPLPRQTPANLHEKLPLSGEQGAVSSDHSPIPIPEMDELGRGHPIAGVERASASRQAAVMKPQNDGPGFSLPNLPSSLSGAASGAAQGMRTEFDRAGRELADRAAEKLGGAAGQFGNALRDPAGPRLPPPGTRTPNANSQMQAPRFTGNDPTGEYARTRQNGPSTEPTNTRDNTWQGLAGARAGGPSTQPIGAVGPNTNSNSATSSRRGANGLGPSDTFAKLPGGLALPSAGDQRGTNQHGTNQRGMAVQDARTAGLTQPSGVYSQYEQFQLDQQRRIAAEQARQRSPTGNTQVNTQVNASQAGQSASAWPGFATKTDPPPQSSTNRDPRLTAAEIAAGAWSLDDYGRPKDRYGKLLTTTTRPTATASNQTRYDQDPRYANQNVSSLPRPNINQPNQPSMAQLNPPVQSQAQRTQSPYLYPATTQNPNNLEPSSRSPSNAAQDHQYPYDQIQYNSAQYNPSPVPAGGHLRGDMIRRDDAIYRSELATQQRAGLTTERDPPSLADRRTASAIGGIRTQPKQVAAQPLFNGLLLISFVANIYLIFWLKNLRLQFHDLVTAKRLSSSSTPAT